MKELSLKINGRVISKKNSKRAIRAGGRLLFIPSKAYEAFKEDCLLQLSGIKSYFDKPIEVKYEFKLKGKLDSDIDNLQSSINDILMDTGIIEDDKLITSVIATKLPGFKEFETRLLIKEIK